VGGREAARTLQEGREKSPRKVVQGKLLGDHLGAPTEAPRCGLMAGSDTAVEVSTAARGEKSK
jgi:hypothetical protein